MDHNGHFSGATALEDHWIVVKFALPTQRLGRTSRITASFKTFDAKQG